jgi:hypothetical protein
MQRRAFVVVGLGLLMASSVLTVSGFAKGKDKTLPPYILAAQTVAVIIDPSAGMDAEDPRANEIAKRDVETALANWGRFLPMTSAQGADLIIVIRKGHGRLADATISDPAQNNRPGMINPTDNGANVGAQNGRVNPNVGGSTPYGSGNQYPQAQVPHPQAEIGGQDDSFIVLDGKTQKPLDGVPGWRSLRQDGLRSHNVPAVDDFRKAVAEAEKAAAAKKP